MMRLAKKRRREHRGSAKADALQVLLNQVRSPLVMLLIAATILSWLLRNHTDAVILLAVVLMSTVLGFVQEYRAALAVASLLAMIQRKATVVRNGREVEIPAEDVVEGDLAVLCAGDTIPGDGILQEAKDLFVDESALTGESFPAEKLVDMKSLVVGQRESRHLVFAGTHVVSGIARVLITRTGPGTELGMISERLLLRGPETDFERGIRQFGELLLRITLVLVVSILAISIFLHRPVLEAFMFALALAVGMTPELLPAIVTIVLAQGARKMAQQHVIVRRLTSIENLGSMDVLCSDKTGTLTEGRVRLHAVLDAEGQSSDQVLTYAVLNAMFESGFANPIDEELRRQQHIDITGYQKFDEVPYDFIRKRLSVVVEDRSNGLRHLMITKGAVNQVLSVCSRVETARGTVAIELMMDQLLSRFSRYCQNGVRVLGIAIRDVTGDPVITKDDEADMTFVGFLLLDDPPKSDAAETIHELVELGVKFKLITGDNRLVAERLYSLLGLPTPQIVTGSDLHAMSDKALLRQVSQIDIFAETEPNQKERILLALRKAGHVVGFLGDGINDATALHAADVGMSVDAAVDVAKEAADIVLLRHDLGILIQGVRTGRITFANTLKYIFITTSANLGNMLGMAVGSVFLPFLPLLPKQILLNNFLSDIPAFTIATDAVDHERVSRPCRWDHQLILHSMIVFGLVSSAFDLLTFGSLLWWLHASESQFQTGWFVESLLTELLIACVLRTHRSVFQSRPSMGFAITTFLITTITLAIPYTTIGASFGFVPLPMGVFGMVIGITVAYLIVSEWAKKAIFARLTTPPV